MQKIKSRNQLKSLPSRLLLPPPNQKFPLLLQRPLKTLAGDRLCAMRSMVLLKMARMFLYHRRLGRISSARNGYLLSNIYQMVRLTGTKLGSSPKASTNVKDTTSPRLSVLSSKPLDTLCSECCSQQIMAYSTARRQQRIPPRHPT